ncbi:MULTISPECIES: hypothetical protein [Okeania]|uniref:Uncharacterized protein n=1 Tax=Okeania hirsuta TaxID=1458930 RepID=A0A3N6PIR1_9CYAN|nr:MULTISPECIES: hypothetical protein [Okeania]NET22838.1 hypothetical protein [Okeania sp. SIO1H5]NET95797.1 hypothetical protein [Okeania sp. SIO1H2]RQH20383.1 hypothetical protein D4Z78_11815 [Okeania hirsuta]RQH52726.1 hypothetical protein D5R40_04890 [Okeania hirsuta]
MELSLASPKKLRYNISIGGFSPLSMTFYSTRKQQDIDIQKRSLNREISQMSLYEAQKKLGGYCIATPQKF